MSTKSKPYPFAEKEEHYRGLSDEALLFSRKDAAEARDSMAGFDADAEAWYADDVHTIVKEISRRLFLGTKEAWLNGFREWVTGGSKPGHMWEAKGFEDAEALNENGGNRPTMKDAAFVWDTQSASIREELSEAVKERGREKELKRLLAETTESLNAARTEVMALRGENEALKAERARKGGAR